MNDIWPHGALHNPATGHYFCSQSCAVENIEGGDVQTIAWKVYQSSADYPAHCHNCRHEIVFDPVDDVE